MTCCFGRDILSSVPVNSNGLMPPYIRRAGTAIVLTSLVRTIVLVPTRVYVGIRLLEWVIHGWDDKARGNR